MARPLAAGIGKSSPRFGLMLIMPRIVHVPATPCAIRGRAATSATAASAMGVRRTAIPSGTPAWEPEDAPLDDQVPVADEARAAHLEGDGQVAALGIAGVGRER